MIEKMDKGRERFINTMTGCSMTDARNYDLCFNTQRVTLDIAEELVVLQVEALRKRLSPSEMS